MVSLVIEEMVGVVPLIVLGLVLLSVADTFEQWVSKVCERETTEIGCSGLVSLKIERVGYFRCKSVRVRKLSVAHSEFESAIIHVLDKASNIEKSDVIVKSLNGVTERNGEDFTLF